MMYRYSILIATALITLSGCAKQNEWDDIDYSGVYQKARENDPNYTQPKPSVLGCVDDDLYNCNVKRK